MDHTDLGISQHKKTQHAHLDDARLQWIVYGVGEDLQVTVYDRSWHSFLQPRLTVWDK